MIVNERAQRQQQLIQAAQQIMTAARTAPKSRGVDIIEILMVTGEEKEAIAQKMESLFNDNGLPFSYETRKTSEMLELFYCLPPPINL